MQLGGLVYTGSGRKQSEPQTWGVSQSSGRGGPRRQEVRMEHGVAVAGARFSGLGVPVLGMGVAGQSRFFPARPQGVNGQLQRLRFLGESLPRWI